MTWRRGTHIAAGLAVVGCVMFATLRAGLALGLPDDWAGILACLAGAGALLFVDRDP